MTPTVLFHTHGIGKFDFSEMQETDLESVNAVAAERDALVCATVYLKQSGFARCGNLLKAYARLRSAGELPNILGFAIEGPVLGPRGGTPDGSVWRPTNLQWREIADWSRLGLKYVVIAPDILELDEEVDCGMTFGELLILIYQSGGRVALGHFEGRSARDSTRKFHDVLTHIEGVFEPSPYLVLTDHLFNDMPRSFKHAFRTSAERASRHGELDRHAAGWTPSSLESLLGPLPAAVLEAARHGRLTPAINFDGGHVDLTICRRVVEYLGADRIIAMTDHIEIGSLAGELLSKDQETALLYRSDGVLAASSVPHEQQRNNMKQLGLSDPAISAMVNRTPLAALSFAPRERTAHSNKT